MKPTYEPDELAVAARRWLLGHRGPPTPATRAALAALGDYYGDTGFLRAVLPWLSRRVEARP